MESLGEKIYNLRKLSGKSQEELGFDIGVSRQAISKWEANTMSPSVENLKSLSAIFNVSTEYFLFDTKSVNEECIIANDIPVNSDRCDVIIVDGNNKRKANKKLIILAVVLGLLLILCIITTISLGCIIFTTNTGFKTIQTIKIDSSIFVIAIVISILVFIAESIIFIRIFSRKR